MTPRLKAAIENFRQRTQFNDDPKLQEIIAAVREEEQQRFRTLVRAAKAILSEPTDA